MATTSTSPLSDNEPIAAPSTADLLVRLPPLPDVKRPFLTPEMVADRVGRGDTAELEEMISGRYLDFMLSELLAHLPDVKQRIAGLGPAGLVLQARPSNTINALTVPTRDGAVIIYNLGFYGMLYSSAIAVSLAIEQNDASQAISWLASMVDWATSRAKEPRSQLLELSDELQTLATNLAGRAQRFAMCHELGHVMAFDRTEAAVRTAKVAGVTVSAFPDTWEKEYAADRDGLTMYMQVLASGGQSAAAALIGAEIFLNAAGMLRESSADEGTAHPPPDDRLDRVRDQFLQACGEKARELEGPSRAVRHTMEMLRGSVTKEVRRRRADTTRQLTAALEAYSTEISGLPSPEARTAAKHLSQFLLASPGATLDFLYEKIFAPMGRDEPNSGSAARLLALNAALHLEKPLREAIEIPRLGL
jgi:hypothetical protein